MSESKRDEFNEYSHLGGPDSVPMHAPGVNHHPALIGTPRKGATTAWVLYDVANTVYAAMLTFLLMPYVTKLGAFETFTYLQTISMILSGLAVPLMASIADRTGKASIYLNFFTTFCILSILIFGASPPMLIFGWSFMVANFTYNSALVFYNALLPSVASADKEGLVSGLGVGLGYLGTLLALAMILLLSDYLSEESLFLLCGMAFLVLSLPVMLLVRDLRDIEKVPFSKALVAEQFRSLTSTIKSLGPNKNLRWFLIGNFLCVDVINTAIVVFVVYMLAVFAGQSVEIFGMNFDLALQVVPELAEIKVAGEKGMKVVLGAGLNVLALAAGVTLGILADRWGALKAMRLAAIALLLAILGGFAFSGTGFSKEGREQLAEQTNAFKSMQKDEQSADFAEMENWWTDFALSEGATIERSTYESKEQESEGEYASLVIRKEASGNGSLFALMLVVLGAFGLAGVWTAGRKVLLDLAPRDKVGEYFGLYGITVKVSVFGTAIFGFIMARASPQVAILSLLGLLVPGILCLMLVRMPKKELSDVEEA